MRERQILFSSNQIATKVSELGKQIAQDYENKNLLVIGLLKGSFVFVADLMRAIDKKIVIEFMTTSSYHDAEHSTGRVEIVQDLERDLTNFDVLIVDDIIDSGLTMKSVYELIKSRNPNSLKTCALLDKPSRRKVEFECDYVGFTIDDLFIVGYGLNYGDYYRNVDHIFIFLQEDEE
ncbi:MAG: hypoxanthine phosphoribosyltransferase [Tissierellia bacterium]|mgnify:CR=1 FL=1|jgi:hypoxanthine phosphoribosyltransferase|nr:hypoxanthine phosphoribosyltransferase [Tissierellia bacterium]